VLVGSPARAGRTAACVFFFPSAATPFLMAGTGFFVRVGFIFRNLAPSFISVVLSPGTVFAFVYSGPGLYNAISLFISDLYIEKISHRFFSYYPHLAYSSRFLVSLGVAVFPLGFFPFPPSTILLLLPLSFPPSSRLYPLA